MDYYNNLKDKKDTDCSFCQIPRFLCRANLSHGVVFGFDSKMRWFASMPSLICLVNHGSQSSKFLFIFSYK